jgi:hypothetical protein
MPLSLASQAASPPNSNKADLPSRTQRPGPHSRPRLHLELTIILLTNKKHHVKIATSRKLRRLRQRTIHRRKRTPRTSRQPPRPHPTKPPTTISSASDSPPSAPKAQHQPKRRRRPLPDLDQRGHWALRAQSLGQARPGKAQGNTPPTPRVAPTHLNLPTCTAMECPQELLNNTRHLTQPDAPRNTLTRSPTNGTQPSRTKPCQALAIHHSSLAQNHAHKPKQIHRTLRTQKRNNSTPCTQSTNLIKMTRQRNRTIPRLEPDTPHGGPTQTPKAPRYPTKLTEPQRQPIPQPQAGAGTIARSPSNAHATGGDQAASTQLMGGGHNPRTGNLQPIPPSTKKRPPKKTRANQDTILRWAVPGLRTSQPAHPHQIECRQATSPPST